MWVGLQGAQGTPCVRIEVFVSPDHLRGSSIRRPRGTTWVHPCILHVVSVIHLPMQTVAEDLEGGTTANFLLLSVQVVVQQHRMMTSSHSRSSSRVTMTALHQHTTCQA